MLLPRFAIPGNLDEIPKSLDAWSNRLSKLFDKLIESSPLFYNPTIEDTPANRAVAPVKWPASPGRLLSERLSSQTRWEIADSDRNEQDEYCEWSVLRDDDGKIERVTFTTETPDYYDLLNDFEPDFLRKLYKDALGREVELKDIQKKNGSYQARNKLNSRTDGPIVHLRQFNNTLRAAVQLAAEATVLRKGKNGKPISTPQSLVRCGGLGDPKRHSDPQIAAAVNNLVAAGSKITLEDPPGLYLDELLTAGIETPDDTDPLTFWTIERGTAERALRARFEVKDKPYKVGDIKIDGTPIDFGAQVADCVRVRIEAVAKKSNVQPKREPCIASSGL